MAGSKATAEVIRTRLPMDERLDDPVRLNGLLRHMAMWRSTLLANTFVRHHGLTIYGGPFRGMEYLNHSTEGCLLPRLLGCYEQELHEDLLAFALEGVEIVVDIGCAEGYYAVGLARLMPEAIVHAYDTDANARRSCAGLAEKNGVADRVRIGELFTGEMFETFADRRTLVMIDTEGFEEAIMRPDLWPALSKLAVIMETHPDKHPDIVATMLARFSGTHDIELRATGPRNVDLPGWLRELPHLDQLLAIWEHRAVQTPWFVMRPKGWSRAA